MKYFVYMLECKGGRYYTGYTTDLERRFQEHLKGTSKSKFTRSFPPLRMAASWEFDTKSEAMKHESYIKKLTRDQKKALIT